MSNDRTIRRLSALQESASTARVLNLLQTHKRFLNDEDVEKKPFFENRVMNHSIIVKHRLRRHEYVHFKVPPPIVTKVLIPIDGADLKLGAHSFFVGQSDYDKILEEHFGKELRPGVRDRMVLDLITRLPTLDTFLLKEFLARNEYFPANAYFAISEGDVRRMIEFVRGEIMILVTMSTGSGASTAAYAARMVDKLLANTADAGFEPLKDTLKLSDTEYSDGMFSWRGFLYYKWQLRDLMAPMASVMNELNDTFGRGARNQEASIYIPEAKRRIVAQLSRTSQNVHKMIGVYDNAYGALTKGQNPTEFRNFLLNAPAMFYNLGEQLGAVQHIISFWRYRFPEGDRRLVSHDELMDMLLDFEDSLTFVN